MLPMNNCKVISEVITMADMFAPLVAQLKANPKTIVFTEGNDPRILEAASKLLAEGVLKVVMVGNEAECKAAAAAGGFDISAAEIIDPENYAGFDEMVHAMVELRKGKQTAEECTALLKKSNYFGTMLVKMGKADCLLGGATYSTADTIRPALQLVKTKKGAHLVSSCFILDRDCGEEGLKRIAMGDCAVNIDYTDTIDKATGEVKVSAASKLADALVGIGRADNCDINGEGGIKELFLALQLNQLDHIARFMGGAVHLSALQAGVLQPSDDGNDLTLHILGKTTHIFLRHKFLL